MTRRENLRVLTAVVAAGLAPATALAQRRRKVVVKPKRTKIVVRPGHPLRRPLPTTVVIREPRKRVVVGPRAVYLSPIVWSATVITLPAKNSLVWQDEETIERDEEWVDCNFGVDDRGKALYLRIRGRTRLNFAEVTFNNGEVQVVDFNERVHGNGTYQLLDFANGRHVATVRLLAKAESDEAALTVLMSV